jgi:hypothetical protein
MMNTVPDSTPEAGSYARNPHMDDPKYLLGDAAMAAGITTTLLKSWLSREPRVIHFGPYDHEGRGKGSTRLFTLRRILSVAIAAELVQLGVTASRAGHLAFIFTDTQFPELGHGNAETSGTMNEHALLVVYPDTEIFNFVPAGSDQSLRSMLARSGRPFTGPASSFVVVSYGAIADRVNAKLAERGK